MLSGYDRRARVRLLFDVWRRMQEVVVDWLWVFPAPGVYAVPTLLGCIYEVRGENINDVSISEGDSSSP